MYLSHRALRRTWELQWSPNTAMARVVAATAGGDREETHDKAAVRPDLYSKGAWEKCCPIPAIFWGVVTMQSASALSTSSFYNNQPQ